MIKLTFSKEAEKDFSRLQKSDKIRVSKKLEGLIENPLMGKELRGELKGTFSLRSWPLRILYLFDKKSSTIIIKKIQHRKEVYKN